MSEKPRSLLDDRDALLAAYAEIGRAILSSMDRRKVIDVLARQIVDVGIFRSLMIALVDADARRIELFESLARRPDLGGRVVVDGQDLAGKRIDLDSDDMTAQVARRGELTVIEEWYRKYDPQNPLRWPEKIAYFIPVKHGDKVVAVLATASALDQKEETLARIHHMEPLLDQFAIALEHARLYRALQDAYADVQRQVAERTAELESANQALERQVAERLQVEETLRQSEARLRALVNSLDEIVFEFDVEGLILDVWVADERLLARPRAEILGRRIDEILGENFTRPFLEIFQRVLASSRPETVEYQLELMGSQRWFLGRISPIAAADERRTLCMLARDITERKQLQELLFQAQKMEAIGQLTAGVAHNFNNLLQGIIGNVQLALEEVDGEPKALLREADNTAQRAADVVRQLLVFSRLNAEPERRIVSLEELVSQVAGICQRTFDRRIALHTCIAADLPPIESDASQLEQVLLNLCINARDALQKSTASDPTIAIDVEAVHAPAERPAAGNACVRVRVRDNGIGMNEETQKRIFEPFFTTKPVGQGTGLGLSMVYGIVQQHGGWIECESRPGEGATFSVYLPASSARPEAAAPESPDPPSQGNKTVLVIEDEAPVRRTAVRMLHRCGYATLEARDGREGLDLFSQQSARIDLILLDLSMPGLSGHQVLAALRQMAPDARVVVSTGYAVRAEDLPASVRVVQKPFSLEELALVVRQALTP